MNMKIFGVLLAALSLLLLPAVNVEAQVAQTQIADPVSMLDGIISLLTERGPDLINQIMSVIMSVLMAVIGFVQVGIQVILDPGGIPLLMNMLLNGLMGSFNWGLTGTIYGGIIGLPLCVVGAIGTAPLGAIAGAILGFFYEALGSYRATYPAPLPSPDWLMP